LLNSAYLTAKQLEIWDMNRQGKSRAEIGQKYEFTRQAAYDVLKISLRKVETALRHTADASSIEIIKVDAKNGILLGKTPVDSSKVIITFSKKHGIQTWHFEEPDCGKCGYAKRCMERLNDEAKERGIVLDEKQRNLPPSKLAHVIFSQLMPELLT
jgi:DNA-binding CsgD family transcriptional regulator